MRDGLPARGAVRLRSVLRAARGRLRPLAASTPSRVKRKIQAGTDGIWRYADFLPFESRPGERARARPDAAGPRRPPRRAARRRRGLGQERRRQPDPLASRTASSPSRWRRRSSSASTPSPAPRPATSPTPSPRTRPPPASTPTSSSPPTSRSRSCSRPTSTGPTLVGVEGNYDDVNRLCTELAQERGWAFVNVNLRPYYAEGSKTLAYEIAEQLGWRLPDRVVCPIASGSLFTKIGRGFDEWLDLGLIEGELPGFHGAQAAGLRPGRDRVRRRPRRLPAGQAGHDRQEPRDRRPGRRPLRARPRARDRRLGRGGHRRRDPRRHPPARGDDRDLHRDRRRRHDRDAGEARRGRRARLRRPGRRLHHRRGPEDARRRPRGLRDARDRADARPRSPRSVGDAAAAVACLSGARC